MLISFNIPILNMRLSTSLVMCFLILHFFTGCAELNKALVNNQWNCVSQKDLKNNQGAIFLGAEAYPSKWAFMGIFESLETGNTFTVSASNGGPGIRMLDPGTYYLKKMILTSMAPEARIEIPVKSNSVIVKNGIVTYVGDFIFTLGEASNADLNDVLHWVGAAVGVFEKSVKVHWRIVSKIADRKKELAVHWGTGDFSVSGMLLQVENVSLPKG